MKKLLTSISQFIRDFVTNHGALRDFPSWCYYTIYLYYIRGKYPTDYEMPWLTFGAIRWLRQYLSETKGTTKIFEWGSGGSTLFFAQYDTEVVSIEYDTSWYNIISQRFAENEDVKMKLVPSQSSGKIKSGDGAYYDKYVAAIEDYDHASFDLIVVDGRVRVECVKAALPYLKSGGILLLDNSERARYQEVYSLLKDWETKDFRGFAPFRLQQTQTSIFVKP